MLFMRDNVDLEFRMEDYEYFKSLRNSTQPLNMSNITVVQFNKSLDLYAACSHRDIWFPENLESDLVERYLKVAGIESIDFMLVFCTTPGETVIPHVHTPHGILENHYQPVMCLSPSNSVDGLIIEGTHFDLSGHNSFLINVKLEHEMLAQKEPNIWLTAFNARLK